MNLPEPIPFLAAGLSPALGITLQANEGSAPLNAGKNRHASICALMQGLPRQA